MLSIYNFEGHCDSRVIYRGESYFYEEAVSLFARKDNTYTAIVSGTYEYDVTTTLGEAGEILEASCNCPYEGDICKHLVAFFLTIRESLIQNINQKIETVSERKKADYLKKLTAAVKEKTVKEIVDILYTVTNNSLILQQQTLALIENKLSATYLINIVEESIKFHGPNKAVIPSIQLVVDLCAGDKDNEIEHTLAFLEIYRILSALKADYDEAESLRQAEDDYDSDYDAYDEDYYNDDYAVFFGKEMLYLLARLIKEKIAAIINNKLATSKDLINGISKFLLSFPFYLEEKNNQLIFTALAPCAHVREVYDSFLEAFNDNLEFPRLYEGVDLFTYDFYFDLISDYGTKTELNAFLRQNREYAPFRERLIKEAIESANYQEAINLAYEANTLLAERYSYHQQKSKWDVYLVEIYTALNEPQNIREPALTLLSSGELSYYDVYKNTFTSEEWKKAIASLYKKLKDSPLVYHYVLAREEEWEKILKIAETDLVALFNIYMYFPQTYGPRIIPLVKAGADSFINGGTGKDYYHGLYYYLVVLQKFLTSTEFTTYVSELRQTYSRRRALLKYLNGLHFPLSDLKPGSFYYAYPY